VMKFGHQQLANVATGAGDEDGVAGHDRPFSWG
jgi:hypothetical protein